MNLMDVITNDLAEHRTPDAESAAPFAEPVAVTLYDRLLVALTRRRSLLDQMEDLERGIDEAYRSGDARRVAWARGEGADRRRQFLTGIRVMESRIQHLCIDMLGDGPANDWRGVTTL